jgi:hypothetical protein
MGLGQGAQALGLGLKQGALGVEHVEKAEFAQLKALGRGIEGALCARQDVPLQQLRFLACAVLRRSWACASSLTKRTSAADSSSRALSVRRNASSKLP